MPYAIGPGGARIHYRVDGEGGDNVVLVQGLGLSSRFWFEQPELLANDPEHPRRVVTLDNRGTGKSDKPRPPYRMSQMADDVVAVMDAAKMRRAVVVGISMGGMIAQHVALRHPNRVDGLVLLATTPGLPHGRLPGLRSIARLISMPLSFGRGGSKALQKLLLADADLGNARELMREWPAALREDRIAPAPFLGQLAAALTHSAGFSLKRLTVPTVIVGAEQDALVPFTNSRRLAKLIPGAKLEVIDCGHGIPITHRDVVKNALAELRAMDAA